MIQQLIDILAKKQSKNIHSNILETIHIEQILKSCDLKQWTLRHKHANGHEARITEIAGEMWDIDHASDNVFPHYPRERTAEQEELYKSLEAKKKTLEQKQKEERAALWEQFKLITEGKYVHLENISSLKLTNFLYII